MSNHVACRHLTVASGQSIEPLPFRASSRNARLTPSMSTSRSPPACATVEEPPSDDKGANEHPSTDDAATFPKKVRPKRVVSEETRRKIAYTMLGRRKSDDMRAKVSQKLKGRTPWNKGKKLSPETRARMSEARFGRTAWNKGIRLSHKHREAIARATGAAGRRLSPDTRRRIRMARRRPGDAIVQGSRSGTSGAASGSYPLVESADINEYVTLRRELRIWSDSFKQRNSRRPSLADVRRIAPRSVIRKFEKYMGMRDKIRGLASDVYGAVNPTDVPVVPAGDVADAPRNNNSETVIRVTKHGNHRLVNEAVSKGSGSVGYAIDGSHLEGSVDDMFDMYDRPVSPGGRSSDPETHSSLIGTHELSKTRKDQLSANDYRMIGKYRLMESIDINRYVGLRKELESWSMAFKELHGRTPALSDAKGNGKSMLYNRFCEYLEMRDQMSGLVREVYGTEIDDMETFQKVNAEGKVILDSLRSGRSRSTDTHVEKSGSVASSQLPSQSTAHNRSMTPGRSESISGHFEP